MRSTNVLKSCTTATYMLTVWTCRSTLIWYTGLVSTVSADRAMWEMEPIAKVNTFLLNQLDTRA